LGLRILQVGRADLAVDKQILKSGGRVSSRMGNENSMSRVFVNALAAILAIMCLVAIALWVRGRSVDDEAYFNVNSHLAIAGSFPNHLDLIFYRQANYHGPVVRILAGDKHVPAKPEYCSFRMNVNAWRLEIGTPWWVLLVFGLMIPALGISRAIERRRKVRRGLCGQCGYDLRATPGRCSECGAVALDSNSGNPAGIPF
jgi:hypothetical protein